MSPGITMAGAITALVAEKRAVGLQVRRRGAGAGPVRRVLPPASSPGWRRPPGPRSRRGSPRPGERGVKPATLQGLAAPVRELARWLGRRGVPAYVLPVGRAAQARPLRPAHLHRPGTGGPVRPDRPLSLRLAGPVPAPGHAGAVPHDLRLRPACLRSPAAALRRRRPRRRGPAIRDGKGGKDRQVPVSAPLRDRLAGYHARVAGRTGGDWFFPGRTGQPLTLANIDKNFRRFLWQARIPHGGRGHGPRVHDLRHTFAVNNLRSWFARGQDVGALLPVLQTYMGHSSIADTDYYLRLTAESYPHITARVQQCLSATSSRPSRQGQAMATDFAVFLHRFLTAHLAGLRGCSPNTIASYRDTFKLLIAFFRDEQIHPARQAHPRSASTPPPSPGSWTGWRPHGTTASRPATSAWPRSARSSGGCNPRTLPGWPAARTFSPSPPRNRPGRA